MPAQLPPTMNPEWFRSEDRTRIMPATHFNTALIARDEPERRGGKVVAAWVTVVTALTAVAVVGTYQIVSGWNAEGEKDNPNLDGGPAIAATVSPKPKPSESKTKTPNPVPTTTVTIETTTTPTPAPTVTATVTETPTTEVPTTPSQEESTLVIGVVHAQESASGDVSKQWFKHKDYGHEKKTADSTLVESQVIDLLRSAGYIVLDDSVDYDKVPALTLSFNGAKQAGVHYEKSQSNFENRVLSECMSAQYAQFVHAAIQSSLDRPVAFTDDIIDQSNTDEPTIVIDVPEGKTKLSQALPHAILAGLIAIEQNRAMIDELCLADLDR